MPAETAKNDTGIVLEITRTFNAPRQRVFDAFIKPDILVKWMGPKTYTAHSVTMNPVKGGNYRLSIRSPEGKENWMFGTYQEIIPPEKLVYTFAWDKTADGKPIHQTLITITFAEAPGNKTTLHFIHNNMLSIKDRDSHNQGWTSTLDRLAELIEQ
jgi:uncharacterized protein YndB with AHSA1/START domain